MKYIIKFKKQILVMVLVLVAVPLLVAPSAKAGFVSSLVDEGVKIGKGAVGEVGKVIKKVVTRNDEATKVATKKSPNRVSPAKAKSTGEPKVTIKKGQTVKVKKSQTVSLKKGQKPTMPRSQADDVIIKTKGSAPSTKTNSGKLWWQQDPPPEFLNAQTNKALYLRDDIAVLKKQLPKRDKGGSYIAKKTDDVEVKIRPKTTKDGREVIVLAKEGGKAKASTKLVVGPSGTTSKALVKRNGKTVDINVPKEPRTRTFIDADGAVRKLEIKPDGSIYVNGSYMGKGAAAAKRIEANLAKVAKRGQKPPRQLTAGDRQLLLEAGEQASTANKWLTRENIAKVGAVSLALYSIHELTNGSGSDAISKINKFDELNGVSKALLAERKELLTAAKKRKTTAPSTRLPSTVYAKGTNSIVFNNSDLVGSVNPRVSESSGKSVREVGNIVVITYVDRERVDKAGNYDARLGNVKVKVSRKGGDNGCTNRKSDNGKTNGLRYHPKNKDVLVKGTINYRNCKTGTYEVELVGRDGYVAVGKKSDQCKIKDDQTCVIKFVLKKATDPDPVIDNETPAELAI